MRKHMLRSSLAAAAVALLLAAEPAAAQAKGSGEAALLRRRVVQLEDRVAQLERQLAEMRSLLQGEQTALAESRAPRPASAYLILSEREGWREPERWRLLQRGLSEIHVRQLLGDPGRVVVSGFTSVWYYPDVGGGRVEFGTESGRVRGWVEP